ncbi:helix-turn-helix domain-containing protein [Streptococcus suis]|uniref:helix-turn-helix domain-containing protein n=1 Tax=Streptococcus suis TaxID=1307 RepID=UPI001ABDC7C6|nr:helix-turn-helix domain-containing protein [Streptococcus suis]
MRQKSIGEVLRSARESHDWSLAEVQRMTEIHPNYLQALEYNDFDYLPDEETTISVLRSYADVLDLDADVLVDAFEHQSLVQYFEAGEEVDIEHKWRRRQKTKRNGKSFLPLVYLLLSALMILIFVTYVVYQRYQMQLLVNQQTSSSYVVSTSSSSTASSTPSNSSSSTSATSSSTTTSSTTSLTSSGGGQVLYVTIPHQETAVTVTLFVTDATSWVSLSNSDIAGGVTLSPENPKVEATIYQGSTAAELVLGVVDGVEVTIAGQKVDTSSLNDTAASLVLTLE